MEPNCQMNMNWHAAPFARIVIPFLLGIVGAYLWDIQISYVLLSLLIFLLGLLFLIAIYFTFRITAYARKQIFGYAINCFLFGFGFLLVYFKYDLHDPWHYKHFLWEQNVVIGKIEQLNNQGAYPRLIIQVKGIKKQSSAFQNCRGNLLLYLRDTAATNLKRGDLLLFKAKILPITDSQNPEAFSFKSYWFAKNIFYQTFVKEDFWQLLEPETGSNFISEIRTYSLQYLRSSLSKENGIAIALLLGTKDYLSVETKKVYARAGAMHVLAVSGLHVGVIAGILQFLLGWIGKKNRRYLPIKVFLLIFGILGFALLSGASASVLRASLMFSIFHIGLLLSRQQNIYNILAASAFIILSIDVFQVLNIGFQLSYLAFLGIVFLQPKFNQLCYVENWILKYVWGLTTVGFAAQITTLPLSLYYFQQFPTYFWLSGPPIIICATCGLLFGLLSLLLSWCPILGNSLGELVHFFTTAMNKIAEFVGHLPGSLWSDIWISPLTLCLLYLVILSMALGIFLKHFKWILASLALFCLVSYKHASYQWDVTTQKGLIVYHISGQTAIDFFEKDRVISLSSPNLDMKKLDYAAKKFRISKNIKQVYQLPIKDTIVQKKNWFYANGLIKFHHFEMAIISHAVGNNNVNKIKVNCLLIRNNPHVSISQVLKVFEFEQLIFDKSNSNYQITKWIKECEALKVPYYDIRSQGAIVMPL